MSIVAINFTAGCFTLPGSGSPRLVTKQFRNLLLFEDDEIQVAYTPAIVFKGFEGGALTATIKGFCETEVTPADVAKFQISMEALTAGDAVNMNVSSSWDTDNVVDVVPLAGTGYPISTDVELANDDDVADGDLVRFRILRTTVGNAMTDGFYVENLLIVEA